MRPECIRTQADIKAALQFFKATLQRQNETLLKIEEAIDKHSQAIQNHNVRLAVIDEWRKRQDDEIKALKARDLIWGTTVAAIVSAIQIALWLQGPAP